MMQPITIKVVYRPALNVQHLGYDYGFKLNAGAALDNGTFPLDGAYTGSDGLIPTTAPIPPGFSITISNYDGTDTLDWSSNFDVEAVVIKSATLANVYTNTTEKQFDTGLGTFMMDRNISHVTFCFNSETVPVTLGYFHSAASRG